MNLKKLEPNLRDEVRSVFAPDMTGVVITKYLCSNGINEELCIDVRLFNEKIYYGSPIRNWEVIKLNDE